MSKRPALTPKQIEKMYDSGENRVTQERSDFLLPQILEWVRQKRWINIRPEYQRRLVWDRRKKSLFIESLLMNIPIPPVFLYEYDLSRYEVMDGQQRLNAVLEFYEGDLVLSGLTTWKALNGLTYSGCPPRIRRGLDRRRISANVLLAENIKKKTDADFIRRTVFESPSSTSRSSSKSCQHDCGRSAGCVRRCAAQSTAARADKDRIDRRESEAFPSGS